MTATELEKRIESREKIPVELIIEFAPIIVETIKSLFAKRKALRQEVEQLKKVCEIQALQIAEIEKKLK